MNSSTRYDNLEVVTFLDGPTNTFSHILVDLSTKKCAVIDSVLDFNTSSGRTNSHAADKIIDYVQQHNLSCEWILETHAHADHLSAAEHIKQKLHGKSAIGEGIKQVQNFFATKVFYLNEFKCDGSQFDKLWQEGDKFSVGSISVEIMHVPGHTPDSVAYNIPSHGIVFVGDTIFAPDVGSARCDFPSGSAEMLWESVERLLSLPDDTKLYLCHDYPKEREFQYITTVAEQKKKNIHFNGDISKQEYVLIRNNRDKILDQPRLIIPSIQVNINAGKLPEPDSNNIVYLKIPINVLPDKSN
jgi:glyoxylase-like metal-dependent hydrolase (beta-lactamase superfamily II)